jgi:hypothetical protein
MNIPKLTSDVSSHKAVLIPGPWPKAYPSEQAIKSTVILPLFLLQGME